MLVVRWNAVLTGAVSDVRVWRDTCLMWVINTGYQARRPCQVQLRIQGVPKGAMLPLSLLKEVTKKIAAIHNVLYFMYPPPRRSWIRC